MTTARLFSDLNFTGVADIAPSFILQVGQQVTGSTGLPIGAQLLFASVLIALIIGIKAGFVRSLTLSSFIGLAISLRMVKLGWMPTSGITWCAVLFVAALFLLFKSDNN